MTVGELQTLLASTIDSWTVQVLTREGELENVEQVDFDPPYENTVLLRLM